MKKIKIIDLPLAIALSFLSIQTILTLYYGQNFNFGARTIRYPLIGMCSLIGIDLLKKGYLYVTKKLPSLKQSLFDSLRFFKHWMPLIILAFSYENLRKLIPHFVNGDVTPYLARFDEWLFGVQPTIWFQDYVHPYLTEYFAFAYSFYFIMTVMVAIAIYLKGNLACFRDMGVGIVTCMYVAFSLYILFPVTPPRFFIRDQYWMDVIPGILNNITQPIYDGAAPASNWCAFPSLHSSLAMLALLYSWRYSYLFKTKKLIFWLLLPIVIGVWVATIYLRHHWFGDLLAGWSIALGAFFLSKRLNYENYCRVKKIFIRTKGFIMGWGQRDQEVSID